MAIVVLVSVPSDEDGDGSGGGDVEAVLALIYQNWFSCSLDPLHLNKPEENHILGVNTFFFYIRNLNLGSSKTGLNFLDPIFADHF